MALIKYPITTEKAIGMIELQNKIVFVVDKSATKPGVKEEVEKTFGVKVAQVNILITPKGQKRAYVKLAKGFSADEVAAKMGVA
ncbi:50S ribosomal protein L23 [Candidatus Gugararchaeum adminiculabundum]|nr:50S ribosomal protein L23 [Candidatus Gugararchaeum adminiculabundum]